MAIEQEKKLQDILEIVEFLKENSMSREYFEEKLSESKNELLTHMDTFIALHQKLDIELPALRSKHDRLENSMKKVLEHLHLDA